MNGRRSSGGGGGGRGRSSQGQQGKDGARRPMFRRRKVCKFCAEKIDDINYKDTKLLISFVPHASAKAADRDHARASARDDSVYERIIAPQAEACALPAFVARRLQPPRQILGSIVSRSERHHRWKSF